MLITNHGHTIKSLSHLLFPSGESHFTSPFYLWYAFCSESEQPEPNFPLQKILLSDSDLHRLTRAC